MRDVVCEGFVDFDGDFVHEPRFPHRPGPVEIGEVFHDAAVDGDKGAVGASTRGQK